MIWLEIAELLGVQPGEAGEREITGYLEALEPEDEPEGEKQGGLAGLLASIIPRSTARKIQDDEVVYSDEDFAGDVPEEPAVEFDPAGAPMLASKGKATAAPPTDKGAINHEVNASQSAPEPVVEDAADGFDPLEGQPDFEGAPEHRPLFGKHVLVTAGPTHEAIDPVRYIANRSTGKQGYAIAAAAAAAGARVTLVSGPVTLATPPGVDRVDVESADEMAAAVKKALPADVAIMVAAVSDWRTKDFAAEKIKKRGSAPPALLLTENPDILATVATGKQRPGLLIGFAAETENVLENAARKRKTKGVDWIVANDVSPKKGKKAMGGDDNTVHLITEGKTEDWKPMSKQAVARQLVERIAEALDGESEVERDD
jgi:phosphopantothenoylcysteine decarboxylase/phosphopantothenate--cysteine ligase